MEINRDTQDSAARRVRNELAFLWQCAWRALVVAFALYLVMILALDYVDAPLPSEMLGHTLAAERAAFNFYPPEEQ